MQLGETKKVRSAMVAAAGAGASTAVWDRGESRVRNQKKTIASAPRASAEEVQAKIAALPVTSTGALWRLFEIVIAVAALIISFPVLVVIGMVVWLDSHGPIIFRQPRVGRSGRLFRFTKFRTMYADAKQRFPHLYAYNYTPDELDVLKFKVPNDPRATRAGRWLRQSTLDELPNFWHVLTGEMALVGPRPEIPEMLPYYSEHGLTKFTVRPGITGLAQVSGRGWLSFHDTVALDVEYVRTRTAWGDIKILALTVHRIVWGHGAF